MSGRKTLPVILIFMVLILSSCAAQVQTPVKTVETLVNEGILLPWGDDAQGIADYEYITVETGLIERYVEHNVRLMAPVSQDLHFERNNGRLKGIYVSEGSRVAEGDVIAELIFDQEKLDADRSRLLVNIEQFERIASSDTIRYEESIKSARIKADEADEENLELELLNLSRLELNYEQFLFNNEKTRKGYQDQLTELGEQLAGEQITAPFDGIITFVYSGRTGTLVRDNARIAVIIDDSRVQMEIRGARDIVRYGDILKITNREETISFNAKVVSDPIAMFTNDNEFDYILEPVDPDIYRQLIGDGDVDFAAIQREGFKALSLAFLAENAVIVEPRAVTPENNSNYVYILENNVRKKRYVQVGFNYGTKIQILDGLEPGQLVVLSR